MGKRILKKIMFYLECLLDIIFPRSENCSGCGRELKDYSRYRLCAQCHSKIRYYDNAKECNFTYEEFTHNAFDSAVISCIYEGLAREMVHKLKYKDKREIAVTLAAIIADNITGKYLNYDYLVPVPISSNKLKKRGYNHVGIIADELSELVHIPILNCLVRVKDTQPQVLFNLHNRWYNVRDCFKCIRNTRNKNILLLDDVISSGATAHFCAEEIKKSGANSVVVISFAKSNLQ